MRRVRARYRRAVFGERALIGAILGVGLSTALLTDLPVGAGVNWGKAIEIGMSLIVSPVAGFILAALLLLALKKAFVDGRMHRTPEQRRSVDDKKHPPFWNRLVLVLSAMGVSFVHGSNDGQKGIGLIMLMLIGIVPAKFVLDPATTPYHIQRTHDAAVHLADFYARNEQLLQAGLPPKREPSETNQPTSFRCVPQDTPAIVQSLSSDLNGVRSYTTLSPETRIRVRRQLLCLDDAVRQIASIDALSSEDVADLHRLRADLTTSTEYAPLWVIIAVALAIGMGTMVGWRRVVHTVGEKIGKQGMTYAQGMAAQLTAVAAIGAANLFSLPVSTTHVLSSGVAGTMVANRSGLQRSTVRNIVLAWLLTFPVSMLLAAGLFTAAVLLLGV